LRAGDRRIGVLEVGRGIGRAAGFAGITVLVLGAAFGALALDEAVRQEHVLDRVVILLDRAHLDQAGGLQFGVDVFRVVARLGRVRGVVVVEGDVEAGEIARMLGMDAGDQLPLA
jgi:hypothetical protein